MHRCVEMVLLRCVLRCVEMVLRCVEMVSRCVEMVLRCVEVVGHASRHHVAHHRRHQTGLLPEWKRGHFSLLVDAATTPSRMQFVDWTKRTVVDLAAERKAHKPFVEEEVCLRVLYGSCSGGCCCARCCMSEQRCMYVHRSPCCSTAAAARPNSAPVTFASSP